MTPTSSPRMAELEYLVEIAKDWTVSCFASARTSGFTIAPHRFQLDGTRVRRRRVKRGSLEAVSPLASLSGRDHPTAWAHSCLVTQFVDSGPETVVVEQEVVEILAADGDLVVAEAAAVIRIPGLPPCLGAFSAPA